MWWRPNRADEFIRERERQLEREARTREARTGQPSYFLKSRRSRTMLTLLESVLVGLAIIAVVIGVMALLSLLVR